MKLVKIKENDVLVIQTVIQLYTDFQSTILMFDFTSKHLWFLPTMLLIGAIIGILFRWLTGILLNKLVNKE